MVKVLPVRTQGPASTRTHWPSLASRATGNLALPHHCSSADGPASRRAGSPHTKPLQKQQFHALPSPFPSLALCVLLAGPSRPCPAPPALLPSLPSRGPRRRRGRTCPRVAAGLGPLHGVGGKASLWLEARDSVSGWV